MSKFPELIHITFEDDSDGGFLRVRENGVFDNDIDQTTPCAIYKRVSEGSILVDRRYNENPKPKRIRKRK
jgi:hypothetical protein